GGWRVVTSQGSDRQTRGGYTSRPRAGLRLHPGVRHGALRRRRCEWEQPHYVSWRPAWAGDAEWMFGKSRTRLAPALTKASSWMSDRSRLHESPWLLGRCARRAQHFGPWGNISV